MKSAAIVNSVNSSAYLCRMIYNQDDIDFSKLTPKDFENLCYELVVGDGFQNVKWNQGGADGGRDIEGTLPFSSPYTNLASTNWFFECKLYTDGVPPQELTSKIAWADAKQPDFLVIFTSSYITKGAREWLGDIQEQKRYKIIIIEGVELKDRLVKNQHLIARYFSADKYMELYKDVLRHRSIYKLTPSMEMINDIISNVDPERFELSDIEFLLSSIYRNYDSFRNEGGEWRNWKMLYGELPSKLLPRLTKVSTQTDLTPFFKDFDFLAGCGFQDEAESETENEMDFQDYVIHMNVSDKDKWRTGYYILIIDNKKQAFEIFTPESASNEVYSMHYANYDEKVLDQILAKYYDADAIAEVKKYSKAIL